MTDIDQAAILAQSMHNESLMAEQRKRDAVAFADIPRREVNDIPYSKIRIENYRKTLDDSELDELAKSIDNAGLLQPPGLIAQPDGTYFLVFGQRRVLACQRTSRYKDTLPTALLWPEPAMRYVQTIALLENMDRSDPPLDEEVAGILSAVKSEFAGHTNPIEAFCLQTGKKLTEVYYKISIAEVMATDERFARLVKQKIITDYTALNDIASALKTPATPARKKYIQQLLDLVEAGKLKGSLRKAASDVRRHVKSGGTKPNVESTDGVTAKSVGIPGDKTPRKPSPTLTVKQLVAFKEKIGGLEPETVTDDLRTEARALIVHLQTLLGQ